MDGRLSRGGAGEWRRLTAGGRRDPRRHRRFLTVRLWHLHQRLADKPDAASVQSLLAPLNRDLRHLAERLDRFDRRQGELIGRAEADKIRERIETAERDRAEDRAAQAALVEQVRGLERRIEEMAPDVEASAQASAVTPPPSTSC